jgi:hypothetical protein
MICVYINFSKNFIGQLWSPKNGQFWAVLACLALYLHCFVQDCSENWRKAQISVKLNVLNDQYFQTIQDGRLAAILNVENWGSYQSVPSDLLCGENACAFIYALKDTVRSYQVLTFLYASLTAKPIMTVQN